MLPYLGKSALGPAVLLLAACSFDASGPASAGAATTSSSGTSSSTGDTSSTSGAPTTDPPTSMGPDGTASDSSSSTTAPVDPTTSTSSTGPDLTTTGTTDPGTTTTTTDSTTDPDTTTSTTTDTTTDPGTSTSTTTDTTTDSSSSTTMGEMCVDPGPEPNGMEGIAVDHGTQGCNAPQKSFSGVLDGDNDLDFHRFLGDFSGMGCGGNDPDPTVSVNLTASDTLQLCVYADCTMANSQAGITCPMGTSASNSPGGHPGCCRSGATNFTMEYVVNCSNGGNESANIFVRFNQAPEGACVDYKVDYSFGNG